MRPSIVVTALVLAVAAAPGAAAQVVPSRPATTERVTEPPPLPAPSSSIPRHPAAAHVHPASDAGATERGLAPVRPGKPGVTNRVQDANDQSRDPQGHLLDPHGRPVGQKPSPPAPATTR
ncbi:hypothetical protein HBF26_01070 [Luteibacter jiangsuensis]|uniref:Uncharacterized protein n=1 Tax=Luteibacter jiangsuensis TaxID=637577 RepID=A0ABX0PYJ3_9GAMM|nr:hypothetical protein [Luteibacter jiangsuensis]NID03460.1 hypothetical protein [Luteibacter jiangsuensis]